MGPRSVFLSASEQRAVAKASPGEFIRQVRNEASKVVWPTWSETVRTAIMVLIMTAILGLFFFAVDSFFSAIVRFLLGLIG
jgi:preprotein translocase subunit SecE